MDQNCGSSEAYVCCTPLRKLHSRQWRLKAFWQKAHDPVFAHGFIGGEQVASGRRTNGLMSLPRFGFESFMRLI